MRRNELNETKGPDGSPLLTRLRNFLSEKKRRLGGTVPETARVYSKTKYLNVKSSADLDPVMVEKIAECVLKSGMNTTAEDINAHMQGDIILVYTDNATSEVCAFSSTVFGTPNQIFDSEELSDAPGCYFAAAAVSKEWQSKGLYRELAKERIGMALDQNVSLIFTRTQSPKVQSGIQKTLDEMVAEGTLNGYSVRRHLMQGCYPVGMLTREKPLDRDIAFGTELSYERGDAYVFMYQLDTPQKV